MFISNTGTPTDVNSNLFTIVSQDLGLGTSNVPTDTTVVQVTYTRDPANTTATAARIEAIVNDAGIVVITGMPTGTTFTIHVTDAGGNPVDVAEDITGNGLTWVDRDTGAVYVAYDTGQCNGQGIWTVGEDGTTHISTPNPVVLYHELSHAWHDLSGTVASTSAAEEVAAEIDENVMRDQVGLPHRLQTDHTGGCGGVTTGPMCRVVTAAFRTDAGTGSTAAVRWLHATRGALLPRFGLGGDLFGQAYAEYLEVSVKVADDMATSPTMRQTTRDLLVEPLLSVYAVAAGRWLRDTTTSHQSGQLSRARYTPLGQAPAPAPDGGLAQTIVAIIESLLADSADARPTGEYSTGRLEGMDGVVEVVAAACSRPLTRWAIIEPLLLYWQLAAAGLDLTDALPKAIEDRAADWIRRAPALYRNPPASAERLTDDLRAVMARMRLTAAEQWALAERLVLLYSDQVDYDLPAAIVQAGMIQTEGPS